MTTAASDARLVRPSSDRLPRYVQALQAGWSANTVRPAAAQEDLARIAADADGFIASLDDREARGAPITMPDGTTQPRLPGFFRWIWADDFCGIINLRWQPGTAELPPHVLGHIGYTVVPWQRQRGHATRALALMLDEARAVGLPWVELSTDADNLASQRTILRNGGVLHERFTKPAAFGGHEALRYRIPL